MFKSLWRSAVLVQNKEMITGDLVHMKLDGVILESTLGVVTGSLGDDQYRVLWLDEASSGAQGTYTGLSLQAMNDEEWQDTLYTDW